MEPSSETAQIDPSSELTAGFSPSPLPPMVDGAPQLEPAKPWRRLEDKDWICLRGPCRHYFRFRHTIDAEVAQEPDENGLPSGVPATEWPDGTPISIPTKVGHYCIPKPGIEMQMEDEIVTECGWWDPEDDKDPEVIARDIRRTRYRLRVLREATQADLDAELEAANTADLARRNLESAETVGDGVPMAVPVTIDIDPDSTPTDPQIPISKAKAKRRR